MKYLRDLFGDPYKLVYMVYGALLTIAVGVLIAFIVVGTERNLVPPLLRVVPQEITVDEPICPGEIVAQEVKLAARRPTVVDLASGIYDVQKRRIIVGTERSLSSPVPEDLNEVPLPIEFEAPDVEPGSYRWVGAVTPKGRSAELAFLNIYFEIGDCP